ncbi:MAG: AAA family ATPase [Burkholderiales bacterium]|nr:AAA family ATPase [Burkholderiales bacterium]
MARMPERWPCTDLDGERLLLGQVLAYPDRVLAAVRGAGVAPETFARAAHQTIWRTLGAEAAAGREIDLASIVAALRRAGELDGVGGPAYVAALVDGHPRWTPAAADQHARDLVQLARHRALSARLVALVDAISGSEGRQGDGIRAQLVEALATFEGGPSAGDGATPLVFQSLADLAREVAAAGPRRYLLRGLWPAGDYGVLAGEMKTQKTWIAGDMAVSVASGTPCLGAFPVDDPGPALMLAGEGGKANILRRLRAIAEARGLVADTLPITVCARAPHLTSDVHLALVRAQIAATRPRLVTLDPLYLSARGANLADLYAMGAVLEALQHDCQRVGAALLVVTHHNRKPGTGATRIVGAGPAEWGRVLIGLTVRSRHTDPATRASDVVTDLDVIGGEIPDQTWRVRRKVWADDPDDLDSPLHVETTVEPVEATAGATDPTADLGPAARKLLEALTEATTATTAAALVDAVARRHGHGLKRETVSRTLNDLARRGLVVATDQPTTPGAFGAKLWQLAAPCDPCDITRSGHTPCDPCDPCDPPYKGVTRSRSHGGHSAPVPATRSHGAPPALDDEVDV